MSEKKIDLSVFCMRARLFLSQGRADDALGLYGMSFKSTQTMLWHMLIVVQCMRC